MFRNKDKDVQEARAGVLYRQALRSLSQMSAQLQDAVQNRHIMASKPAAVAKSVADDLQDLAVCKEAPGALRQHFADLGNKLADVAESAASPAATGAALAAMEEGTYESLIFACSTCDQIKTYDEGDAVGILSSMGSVALGAASRGLDMLQSSIEFSMGSTAVESIKSAQQACILYGPDDAGAAMNLCLREEHGLLRGLPVVADFRRVAESGLSAAEQGRHAWELLRVHGMKLLTLLTPLLEDALYKLRTMQLMGILRDRRDLTPYAYRVVTACLVALGALYDIDALMHKGGKGGSSWQAVRLDSLVAIQDPVGYLYSLLVGNGNAGPAATLQGGNTNLASSATSEAVSGKVARSEMVKQQQGALQLQGPQQQQHMLQQQQQQQQQRPTAWAVGGHGEAHKHSGQSSGGLRGPAAAAAHGAENMDLF